MILLDTHAWISMVDAPKLLGRAPRRVIAKADRVGVAAVSMWELASLVEKGRLSLDRELLEWIRDALGQERLEVRIGLRGDTRGVYRGGYPSCLRYSPPPHSRDPQRLPC